MDPDAGLPALRGDRHAGPQRKPQAKRAGGGVHAGNRDAGVALQQAADFAQAVELLLREEAALPQRGVQDGRGVPLGEDQPVAEGDFGEAVS